MKTTLARVILLTRLPVPGQVKTRLIPALGAEGAAALQARLGLRLARRLGTQALAAPFRAGGVLHRRQRGPGPGLAGGRPALPIPRDRATWGRACSTPCTGAWSRARPGWCWWAAICPASPANTWSQALAALQRRAPGAGRQHRRRLLPHRPVAPGPGPAGPARLGDPGRGARARAAGAGPDRRPAPAPARPGHAPGPGLLARQGPGALSPRTNPSGA